MMSSASYSSGRFSSDAHHGGGSLGWGGFHSVVSSLLTGVNLVFTRRRVGLKSVPCKSGHCGRMSSIIAKTSTGGSHSSTYVLPFTALVMTKAAMGLGVAHPIQRHLDTLERKSPTSLVATPFRRCSGNTANESIQPTDPVVEFNMRAYRYPTISSECIPTNR